MNRTEKQLLKVILRNVRAEITDDNNCDVDGVTTNDRAVIDNIVRKLKL